MRSRSASVIFTMVLLTLAIFFAVPAHAASREKARNIVLLNSYDQKMAWAEELLRGIEDTLEPEENNLALHIENMDTKVFHSTPYLDAFRHYLEVKYRSTAISLLLATDNNAYDFLRTHRDTLFPGVPVAFCGVNDFEPEQLRGLRDFTGVAEIFSARETVELILRNHPGTREIFIVNDYLKTGRAWARDIDVELRELAGRVRFSHAENLSLMELRAKIATLSPDTVVLLGVFYADREGYHSTYERMGVQIAEASRVPVYCLVEFNIHGGVVGGKVISGFVQGQAMAQIGLRILGGVDADTISVRKEGLNRYIFDHRQLERFRIRRSLLPTESLILNRPHSLYQDYRYQIWTVLLLICTLVLTIVVLIANIGRRKGVEQALQESENRFRQLANATWEAIVVHDKGHFLHGNDPFYALFGFEQGELDNVAVIPRIIAPESLAEVERWIAEARVTPYEVMARKKSGETFPVEIRAREIEYAGRDVRIAAIRDLTGRKRMEQRLSQSQKLEAIGTLAGGIAHDFNNILSAIIGYCELARLEGAEDGAPVKKYLGEILKAGHRAKELVQQILMFARKSVLEKEPVKVAEVVEEGMKMLRATLPTSIAINTVIDSRARVLSDTTKIHQVLMNLCTNAGKAMKDGGTLTVSVTEEYLDQEFIARNLGYMAGTHLKLQVRDTGTGIVREDLPKIFDPFFTTRPKEEGTGLGLSVVHGIVRDCHGFITVRSEPGRGSEFTVYLPVEAGDAIDKTDLDEEMPGGTERILLVDDEEMLVEMMGNLLTKLGYAVTGFTCPVEALHAFTAAPEAVDLVISDMTMPYMTGDLLVEKLLAIRPDLPIILNTGFSDKLTEEQALAMGVRRFVMKPIEITTLAPAIREALSSR